MAARGGQAQMLIILSGLPGVGKTSIARELARQTGATHIRIDSIEQAIRASGLIAGSLDDVGYRVGYAVAEDNLRLGRTVVADSVNPLPITREAWRGVARRAGVGSLEVEVICSDASEHRRRVESRPAEPGTSLTWQDVVARDYRPWDRERIVLDTARRTIGETVHRLRASITECG
jgi:predicted kinase